jgi:hypothetical protein
MTGLSTVARECLAKLSMCTVRLLRLGATMLPIMAWAGAGVAAETITPLRRVLVLYSDERLLPANVIVDKAIQETFAADTKNRIEFYSEFSMWLASRARSSSNGSGSFLGTNINPGHPIW